MECNKDEAIRVRDIAELKFAKKDLVGAKKFILKALQLYPDLDFAIQLSAVLDVHIAAQVEVGINEPEPDYYAILQVEPLSDDSTIKKQYRNLSKLVHPGKSKESMKEKSGAAFKLIAKAFEVLSDEETRFQHDSKRVEKPTAKEPPKPTYSTRQPQQQDVKRGGTPRANPQPQPEPWKQEPPKATYSANQPRHQAAAQPSPAPGAQVSQAPNTFWAQPTAAPSAQASQAPYTFWAQPSPAPGAQASQAPNTFWAQPSPAPGAQGSQAPNTFWAQPSPASGAQASQAPNTFWTPSSPGTGAQASQAPYFFWTACPLCRMQYQCMHIFLNNQVVCQKCHFSFPANDINVHPANGASAFVWPPGLLENNPSLAGTNWYEMFQNHLAQPYGASTNGTPWNGLLPFLNGANPYGDYGASTNGTSWNDLLPFLNGANPYGDYGASTNGTSWNDLLSTFSGANPFGDNQSPAQFCVSMLLSAMNLS